MEVDYQASTILAIIAWFITLMFYIDVKFNTEKLKHEEEFTIDDSVLDDILEKFD